jgi:hypothetical protein
MKYDSSDVTWREENNHDIRTALSVLLDAVEDAAKNDMHEACVNLTQLLKIKAGLESAMRHGLLEPWNLYVESGGVEEGVTTLAIIPSHDFHGIRSLLGLKGDEALPQPHATFVAGTRSHARTIAEYIVHKENSSLPVNETEDTP